MASQIKESDAGGNNNNDSESKLLYIIQSQPKTADLLSPGAESKSIMLKKEIKTDDASLRTAESSNMNSSFGKTVNALRKLQFETIQLESEFFKEVHALEAKYDKKYAVFYAKRSKIVSGEYIPAIEECEFSVNEANNIYDKVQLFSENEKKTGSMKGIPRFWLTVLKHSEIIDDMIEPYDEPILDSLRDITVKILDNPMGFVLEFHFSPNEYFTNSVLTKQYEMRNVVSETDPFNFEGPEIIKSKGCVIDWKKGRNVTVKTVIKTVKIKQRNSFKTVTKTVNADSFFNFFDPAILSDDDDFEDDQSKLLLTSDFELGHFIRERIVPRAVLYYTGEALDLTDDLDSEEEMAIEDDEEDEEEDEEEEEDDDDDAN